MFGQKPARCRRISQMISNRRHGLFYFLLLVSCIPAATFAQTNREVVDQTSRPPSVPATTIHEFTPEPTFWKRLFENMHGSYGVTLMGPRFIGNSNETFNIYVPDVAPIQLNHVANLYFQVSPDMTVGFGFNAVQNIADDVVGETGVIRGQSFEMYDPTIEFTFPNLVKVDGWMVFTSANFSLSLTDYSNRIGRITQLNINQSWTLNNYPSDWSFGFNVNLNPQFYTQPFPQGFTFRKTFYASVGHFISYRISPQVRIFNNSTLDVEHREPGNGFLELLSGLDDRTRFGITVSPNVFPTFMSFGGYMQILLWNPQIETTILGLDFSIGF